MLTVSIHTQYGETITTFKGVFTQLLLIPPLLSSCPIFLPSYLSLSFTPPLPSPLPQVPHVANKFQRLRHFHYFLWILTHGFTSCEEGRGVKEEGEEEGERQQSEPCGSSQLQNVCKFIVSHTGAGWVWFTTM